MHAEAAAIIQRKLEAEGVTILFGRNVDRVIRRGNRVEVVTSFSEILPADLVIVGKGVQPNTELVKHTGMRVGTGILVDDQMRTNLEDIYAAGDVAEGRNSITGQMEVIATWSNASAQGETAGLNMAGHSSQRQGQFRDNVTSILGVDAVSIGVSRPVEGEFRELIYDNEKEGVYRKLFLDRSRIVGALLLGRIEDAGVIRHCIAKGLDVLPWEKMIAMAPLDFGKILFGQDFRIPFYRG
jgi:NAD(P)H-nitrite reductase large subunit